MARNGRLLVVDDESSLRLLLSKELSREGFEVDVAETGDEALAMLREHSYQVVLLDIVMPGMDGLEVLTRMREEPGGPEVIMLTGNATVESAIQCMKHGASEYVRKPYSLQELLIHIDRALERQRSQLGIAVLKEDLRRSGYPAGIIGTSEAMARLRQMVERVAATNSTALILGESGVGKEVTARAIHNCSERRLTQFVAINCASFSETLLESELFGHEKGAFTDAKMQKRGLAEIADGGTLFLDEIGEIPTRFQAKLLRFLETGEIRRVGGTRDIKLNVRILCATNRDLLEQIQRREFREDLFYRLNVLALTVPPLREHRDDVPMLVENFLAQLGFNKRFDATSLAALQAYDWPGNVRELRNVVERACIMSSGQLVTARDLAFMRFGAAVPAAGAVPAAPVAPAEPLVVQAPVSATLAEVERQHIVRVLEHADGHKARAAVMLGISTKTLYNKIKVYDIRQSFN